MTKKKRSLLTKSERKYAEMMAQFAPQLALYIEMKKQARRLAKEKRRARLRRQRNPDWPVAGYYYDASGSAGGTGTVRKIGR